VPAAFDDGGAMENALGAISGAIDTAGTALEVGDGGFVGLMTVNEDYSEVGRASVWEIEVPALMGIAVPSIVVDLESQLVLAMRLLLVIVLSILYVHNLIRFFKI